MKDLKYDKPKIVAEIGCNHKGDLEIAKELIAIASLSGADYAKFQKRNPKELLSSEQYETPHPNKMHSYGKTYGEHREFLEFSIDQHAELKSFCESKEIGYATSVWDITSAREIVSLNPDLIKIPSACNNHEELLRMLMESFQGEIHISLGMTTRDEEKRLLDIFEKSDSGRGRVVLYSCTSGYPVPFESIFLREIERLSSQYKDRVKAIGFSGHHLGIAIDIAAYTLGAKWIERHFTKDRTWKGTDHAASLEPGGLQKLVRDLNATFEALQYKSSDILEIEVPQRAKLKYQKK